ncbi:IL10RB [Branchiostoma lanceolatum]|uniref:IL10RB protein n=1 Tax=Branchiostoma lanceolatum TaxID=7740 RepID=A0A8J9ZCE3_BRALA|nr:IL10RB [Branchiostoma lanceolatum]
MALGVSGNHTVTKTVAVFLSLTVILFAPTKGRVSAMNNPTLQTERSEDYVAKIPARNETLPPTNIRVDSRNLNNVVCWDAGGETSDNKVTFDAQYIDDMEYKKSLDTWKYISDCEGVSGPCCAFFDDISVKDLETGKPICPRANGWWVRARAVGILGPSRWTTTSEWFSPFKHTVIGPPDVDVIAKPANEEASSAQQLRELNIRIKHPLTPYYMYNEHNQETMATMEDFEGFFVFYNVSYWMNGHREESRDFVVGNDGWLKEEYSITGLRPGVVYCVEVTGFVHSLWAVRKGLPSKVCRRTADGKPFTGPFNVTWRPLPATNCSAATRSFRSIRVRWIPPPANDANGVITKYKVTIKHSTEKGELATIRDCVDSHLQLSGLTTFHAYTVQPSACTSAGCTKGEKLRIPSHVINSVAPTNLTKADVTSEKITVTWFPPENEYDCLDVYKVRYVELSGGTLRQVTVANTTAVLTKLHPVTSYNVSVSVLYKRINHSSKSSPVESPPTPWITSKQLILQHYEQLILQHYKQLTLQQSKQLILQHYEQLILQHYKYLTLQQNKHLILHQYRQLILQQYKQRILLQQYKQLTLQQYRQLILQQYRQLILQQHKQLILQQYRQRILQQYRQRILQQYRQRILQQYRQLILQHHKQLILQQYRQRILQQYRQRILQQYRQRILQQYRQRILQQYRQLILQQYRQRILQQYRQRILQQHKQRILQQYRQLILQQYKQRILLQQYKQLTLQQHKQLILQQYRQLILQHYKQLILQQYRQRILQQYRQLILQQYRQLILQQHKQLILQQYRQLIPQQYRRRILQQYRQLILQQYRQLILQQYKQLILQQYRQRILQQYRQLILQQHKQLILQQYRQRILQHYKQLILP